MRPNTLALALALATLALPMSALAQEAESTENPAQQTEAVDEAPAEESNLSWNLALTSDYVFRGVTQTDFQPALQGGLDYAFGDSGFYAGVWASNVDFVDPDGPDVEFDSFVGWSHDITDQVNLDLSVVHYTYFGESDDYGNLDYAEFFAKATWNEMLTFTVAYAPDYSNADFSSTYVNLAGSWEIGNEFSLNAGVGHSEFSEDNGSYTDWNLGVSRQFGPVNAALNYYDTSIDGDNVSDTVVLTLGLGS